MYQIIGSLVAAERYFANFKRSIHICRTLYGTHYDTLKLSRNCTPKEVRDSFIKLSKQCHPDRNRNDPNTHAKFVKLNEAYSVLSRPDKRRLYDLTLKPSSSERYHRPSHGSPFDIYTTAYRERVVWRDESFWEYKDRNSQSGDFYGIRGLKRVPNGWIAIMCVIFAGLGVWLQVLLIKHSTTFNRNVLDERSQEASRMLSGVQERAQKHGNKVQLELLKQRFEKSESSDGTSVCSEDMRELTPGSNDKIDSTIDVADTDLYSRTNLGYLGDMPHRISSDVRLVTEEKLIMPELHNIPRNKNIENHVNTESVPKPISFNSGNAQNGKNSGSLVLPSMPSDICKKSNKTNTLLNLSELIFYHKSESVGQENKIVKTNLEFLNTSTKLQNKGGVTENDLNSLCKFENERVKSRRFPVEINSSTSASSCILSELPAYALPVEPRFKMLYENSFGESDEKMSEPSDPIMLTNLMLTTDSKLHTIFSSNNLR